VAKIELIWGMDRSRQPNAKKQYYASMVVYNCVFAVNIAQAKYAILRNHNPLVGGSSPLTATILNPLFLTS
jgi:hypothetical protein